MICNLGDPLSLRHLVAAPLLRHLTLIVSARIELMTILKLHLITIHNELEFEIAESVAG